MKKSIVVTFTDGTNQTMDAYKLEQGIQSLNTPANHPLYLQVAQQIATMGVIADGHNEKHARYIAPSQIKEVEIIFEGESKLKLTTDN